MDGPKDVSESQTKKVWSVFDGVYRRGDEKTSYTCRYKRTEVMNYVTECDRLIEAMVGKDLVNKWWSSPNKAFDGTTPAEMFSEDPRSVYEYLMWHAYGAGG